MSIGPLHGRTVYGLASTEDRVVRYVGSTSKPLAMRLAGHWHACRGIFLTPVHQWMAAIEGRVVAITLIENACFWCEQAEIARRLGAGEPLLNVRVSGLPLNLDAYRSLGAGRARATHAVERRLARVERAA